MADTAAEALINASKQKAKVIDGVPYMPTGYEGKSLSELIAVMNKSYGKIGKISVGQNENAADPNSDLNDNGFSTNPSVIKAVNLTDCPAPTTDILPGYSKEEIEKVVKQSSEECEVRKAIPNILNNVQLSEAIDAKCDIKIAEPPAPAEFLPDTPFEPAPEKEPKNPLAPPAKTLVTLNTVKGLAKPGSKTAAVEILKNVGDKVICGETVMRVGGKNVNCPVKEGVIKVIYTKNAAAKNNRLFLVEEPNPVDTTQKIFDESENLKKKIDEMILLKDKLGKMEAEVWTKKIIWGIYEGQYQGYVAYYQKFDDLITQRTALNDEFITNKKKLEDLFYTYTWNTKIEATTTAPATSTTNSEKWILPNNYNADKTKQIKELLARQDEIITSINSVTSQLDVVRSEQPTYFALDKTAEVKASVTSVPYTKGVKGSRYTLIPFTSGGKLSSPYVDILKGLPPIIKPFTNDILLLDRYFDRWTDVLNTTIGQLKTPIYIDINKKDAFSYSGLGLVSGSATDYNFDVKGGYQRWSGSMWQTRVDFFNSATAVSKGIKPTDDPDEVIKKSGDLSAQERALPFTIEKLATDNFNAVVEYCKNFGYYILNDGSIFIQNGTNKTTELDNKRKSHQEIFEKIYKEYTETRDKIIVIEKYIDDFPQIIRDLASGGCQMEDGGAPTAGTLDGEKIRIIPWPVKPEPLPLPPDAPEADKKAAAEAAAAGVPPDDVNYKGNPQPNSPPVTNLSYWKKYCKRATTVNLLPTYWPIGILIPTPSGLIKIPMPIIWKPLAVVPSPLAVIVIGLTLCGICPGPFIFVVNPGWPFPIGMVAPKASWFVVGNRGPKQIDGETTSEVNSSSIPTVNVPLKYTKNGQTVKTNVKINIGPIVTMLLPFTQDDLPPYERLTMSNVVYLLYLAKWCKQGKNTYGFFTS